MWSACFEVNFGCIDEVELIIGFESNSLKNNAMFRLFHQEKLCDQFS